MKIGIAQINSVVGDLKWNADEILSKYKELVSLGADLVVTPELSITGYPPRDLLFKSKFIDDNLAVIENLSKSIGNIPIVVGCVEYNTQDSGNPFQNAALVIQNNQIIEKPKVIIWFKFYYPNCNK